MKGSAVLYLFAVCAGLVVLDLLIMHFHKTETT